VTVSGEPSRLPGGRRHERELYQTYSNATGQRDSLERGTASSASSAVSWVSHDHAAISSAAAGVVIYSGFEKMNVLAAGATSSASANAIQSRKPVAGGGSSSSKLQASSRPREGPHCEQFLKKIGLNKPEAADGPEHHCSYRNKYCLRWQVYFKQLSSILTNGEAVCIEVYLGPENHTILLEQWILKLVMTKSPATMTIQSLCAAIRSQLYFSQISAWSDLIKKSLEPDLFSNPRIKKLIPAAKCKAGGGSPFSLAQARLDILFRIRTYDNTACFNEKPNVHNFPDASVADNFVIQVCLKSLPRLDRIPGIDAALDAAKMSATLQKQQQVDRIPLPCHEKGKHRCAFRVELEEEEDDDDSSMDSMLLTSAAISHREKQLLKYRKRMLKREKKKKAGGAVGEGNSNASPTSSSSNTSSGATSVSDRNGSGSADGNHPSTEPTANNACSNGNCRNALTSSINSIQPPLYSSTDRHQAMMVCDDRFHAIATNSKSTQTATAALSVDLLLPPLVSVATQTEPTVSTAMKRNRAIANEAPALQQGDLLLQAMQRTAMLNGSSERDGQERYGRAKNVHGNVALNNNNYTTANNNFVERDCRLCKRQKTKHNFKLNLTPLLSSAAEVPPSSSKKEASKKTTMIAASTVLDCGSTPPGCPSGESSRTAIGTSAKCGHQSTRRHRPHTSTPAGNDTVCKEPLYISCSETDCSVSTASSVSPHKKQILSCAAIGSATSTSEGRTTARGEDFSNTLKQQLTQHKTSSKINLNYVFCLSPLARDDSGFTSGSSPATSTTFPATSPIAIDDAGTPLSGTIKSKSAPAFPFSPPLGGGALSPRFLRNAQRQFHHRSRYPSERSSFSERSSIGSDEQFSDDDLSSYLLLIERRQLLHKVLNRNLFRFGRAPMLGTLEESLLQRRLSPKFQVADFKVLLGASGSFCPTQLTIPAASYFYELPGQHLTTPYVCELRLPRKGYSIPRTGTVQATLLNPLGTVVRMFVVPYDFRDMPAMSTTFIRQRILACDDSSLKLLGKNIEQLSNAEQMKLLRYAIHLRFQTSRSGKLSLHTDIRLLISRRTDCDTAAAHAKNLLESPNELKVVTIVPDNPKFSLRIDKQQ
ncbi:AGAP009915-PA, partial [Anopheles gambiae str. PEST]